MNHNTDKPSFEIRLPNDFNNISVDIMSYGVRKIILDVDVGIDDYLAILIFIIAEIRGKVKIEAIVCAAGNTKVENSCTNVVRLLETIERVDIPVYKGATKHLIPVKKIPYWFGPDGLGGLEYSTRPNMSIIRKEPASLAIAKLILKNPNQITLICLGPMTNPALSIRLFDEFSDSIKDLWIMGGNYKPRETSSRAEFNFYLDPEAVYIAFKSVKKPIFLLTWETCMQPKVLMEWHYEVFDAKNNPEIKLLRRAERNFYKKNATIWTPCDAFLAAAFFDPENIIQKKSVHNASVDLHGTSTRGMLVLDDPDAIKEDLILIEEINPQLFKKIITEL